MLTPNELEALARKHGATSYRNRADTQHPAYGFNEAGLQALIAEAKAATLATVTPLVQQLERWKVGDRVISDGIHRDRLATITEVFVGFRYKLDEPHHLGHRQGWITDGTVYDTSGWRKLPATKESNHGTHEN